MSRLVIIVGLFLVILTPTSIFPQQKKDAAASLPVQLLKRTTTRRETSRFNFGGTVTVVGAPRGSVTVEGWSRSEVEVVADIEINAPTEADLDQLVKVNTFVFDEDLNHISVLTTGTHDRAYMKKFAKNFPKKLLNLPWKIDYKVRVPANTDLEINAGYGPVKVSAVEGAMRVSATESETTLTLTGGLVTATVTAGVVTLNIPVRSWRGGGAEIRLATGVINVDLPAGFSGDIDAEILRNGKIVNSHDGLAAREKPGITERSVRARAGAGGAFFKFTVGDGTVNIRKSAQ
ncbi:MAG TPA: hypothetical protein VFS76_10050 [Pyrinomonadaceae bacterium]|nr:hypothetical protein [Pyrinomonadaceae bacterium]